jgi:hypothetical protein
MAPPVVHRGLKESHGRVLTQVGQLTHPHPRVPMYPHVPRIRPTLRTAGALQGAPPSCCGRRAVWSGVRSRPPVQRQRRASSLRTWRWRARRSPCTSFPTTHPPYVPRPSALDHVDRDMLQRLSCSRTATVVCMVPSTSGLLRAERGWVTAVIARNRGVGFGREDRGASWRRAMGKRQCELEGCSKQALSGGTPHCTAHGGGKRCQEEACTKAAVAGGTPCCVAHGGGKRCQHEGCSKSARGDTQHCVPHGGGRRCQHVGCPKAAASVGTPHCIPHGGGRRCQHEGCSKTARGDTEHCIAHGGGRRCQKEGGCYRRHAALRRARRGQAVPEGGLPQGS